ncbi:hypothetical protein ACFV9D_22950 [Streptomyces sp. NPDC059875]|uniref:hypothetical protein n=1 Tax=unclassified Streptomyces TaxID=2593676 RepID=UPI00365536A1
MSALHCLFCGVPVRTPREHVLPTWFLKRFNGQGPFTVHVNGKPVPYANGVVERPQLTRLMLPACGQETSGGLKCNDWLNTTFEQPAKTPVRALLDELRPLSGPGVYVFARWAVKTLLLAAHPEAVYSEPPRRDRQPWEFPEGWLPALRSTGELPTELSLWLSIADPDMPDGDGEAVPDDQLLLPRIHHPDGGGGPGQAIHLGFGLPNGRVAQLQLLSHPKMDIDHPFESAGLAVRLWPSPPDHLDITELRPLSRTAGRQFTRTFIRGGASVHLQAGQSRLPEDLLSPRIRVRLASEPTPKNSP